jgi:hypothetical protein
MHNKNKMHGQTQLYFKRTSLLYSYLFQFILNHPQAFIQNLQNTATCSSSYWIIIRPSYKTFKTPLHVPVHTESSSGLHTKPSKHSSTLCTILWWDITNTLFKSLTLFCSTCKFFYFFLKFSSNIVPRWKHIFIKTKILDWCSSVPACECVHRDAEQVFLKTKFIILLKKFKKKPSRSSKVHKYYLCLLVAFHCEYYFYLLFYVAQCYMLSR